MDPSKKASNRIPNIGRGRRGRGINQAKRGFYNRGRGRGRGGPSPNVPSTEAMHVDSPEKLNPLANEFVPNSKENQSAPSNKDIASGSSASTMKYRGGGKEEKQTGSISNRGRKCQYQRKYTVKPSTRGMSEEQAEMKSAKVMGHSKMKYNVGAGLLESKSGKNEGTTELCDIISKGLINETYDCIICYGKIRRKQQSWSCNTCFVVFHLQCVAKWSKSDQNDGDSSTWRCAGCQGPQSSPPNTYKCFCGQTDNPKVDAYVSVPHSCGDACGRVGRRAGSPNCPHPCTLMCHPGPCPPCPSLALPLPCHCGKTTKQHRCGVPVPVHSCGGTCGLMLSCNIHRCKKLCHPSACDDCGFTELQHCFCGRHSEQRKCGTGTAIIKSNGKKERKYSCGTACGKQLSCGHHLCESVCHDGNCSGCKLMDRSTCPCGNLKIPRPESCLDEIITCGEICGKELECSRHFCSVMCHPGPCPSYSKEDCVLPVSVRCRCGRTEKELPCKEVDKEPLLCSRVCSALRNCGRHQCGIRCCAEDRVDRKGKKWEQKQDIDSESVHMCLLPCNKNLRCGIHTCENLCHKGRCPVCLHVSYDELSCTCGNTIVFPPVPCGTPPPSCPFPCQKTRDCGHPQTNHLCHFGGCPPCPTLITVPCYGNHIRRANVPCHVAQNGISCGRKCGKTLKSCGEHTCNRICHKGECEGYFAPQTAWGTAMVKGKEEEKDKEEEEEERSPKLHSCGQQCAKPLSCEHPCAAKCHPATPCPEQLCHFLITARCKCGRLTSEIECNAKEEAVKNGRDVLLCNLECEIESRNARLASALGIPEQRDIDDIHPLQHTGAQGIMPQAFSSIVGVYDHLMKNEPSFSPKEVVYIEQCFSDLMKDRRIKAALKPMIRGERKLVHMLADFWHLQTQSFDVEPMRYVEVRPTPTARIPDWKLTDIKPISVDKLELDYDNSEQSARFHSQRQVYSVLICDVDPELSNSSLCGMLAVTSEDLADACHFHWVNDDDVLIEFDKREEADEAYRILQGFSFSSIRRHDGPNPPSDVWQQPGKKHVARETKTQRPLLTKERIEKGKSEIMSKDIPETGNMWSALNEPVTGQILKPQNYKRNVKDMWEDNEQVDSTPFEDPWVTNETPKHVSSPVESKSDIDDWEVLADD